MRDYSDIHKKMGHSQKKDAIKNKPEKFSQKNVDLAETPLFFPEGYEKIFLVIYIVSLPYIMGLLLLFFVIAESNTVRFLRLNEDSSFLLTWAIGYEILAGLIILWIIKLSIGFANESRKPGIKKFRRP